MVFLNTAIHEASGWVSLETAVAQLLCLLMAISLYHWLLIPSSWCPD